MQIKDLRSSNSIIYECISGSQAYGLALPTSDIDKKGVYVLPRAQFFGLNPIEQVNNPTNDLMFYELGKFIDLLSKNNPNLLEMIATPKECILHKHPLFDQLKPELFLSKLCKQTFAGYAVTQIRKARGLNKKIMNPMKKKRKGILEFCYILSGQGSVPLVTWLAEKGIQQEHCGLVNIPHAHNLYAVFHDAYADNPIKSLKFKGITQKPYSNTVSLSSIPKALRPIGYMSFSKDGYTRYCKDYKAYWDWVEKRNDARYQNTLSHGKNYDAKNMMHTFRLLDMAADIAQKGEIIVRRPNRDYLLNIRAGKFEYEDLVKQAEERVAQIEELYAKSELPDMPNKKKIEDCLVAMRESFYLT